MLEKKEKKSNSKIQNRKKMINQMKKVCIMARTETVIGNRFENFITINWCIVLV